MQALHKLFKGNKGFVLFLGFMFVFRSACADWNYVPSSSMNPTVYAGDRVLVDKRAYGLRVPFTLMELARWGSPQRGDVITFDSPDDGLNLIKRVVAVGGDTVSMWNNVLIINGRQANRELMEQEKLIPTESGKIKEQIWREQHQGFAIEVARTPSLNRMTSFAPVAIPKGYVMVLGDNRDNSRDSRFIGLIDVRRVTGRAVRVVMSHNPELMYVPRPDRWWLPLQLPS